MGDRHKVNPNNREELDISAQDMKQSNALVLVGIIAAMLLLALMLNMGPFSGEQSTNIDQTSSMSITIRK
jgi:hypothetical protein